MQALVLEDLRDLKLRSDVPVPEIGAKDVLIQVKACGICGSDVHGYDGSSGRRIPPLIMGHEASGTVDAVGREVTAFRVGDRVTFDSTVSCGACRHCEAGDVNLCDRRQVVGVSCGDYRRHGAFAEYVSVPSRILYKLPNNLPFAEAAMLEAIAVAMYGVSLAEIAPDATALVVGAGMIGLLTLQALRAAGCSRIFIADIDQTRLNLAKQIGAGTVLNSKDPNFLAQILDLTNGQGVDVTIEAVGRTET